MKDKNILITGATRGLGCALALQLAEEGAHIIAMARTTGALTELDDAIKKLSGKPATLIPFDLLNMPDAYANLGQTIYNRFRRLDAVVLNAARLGALTPVSHCQEKDWQRIMEVNLGANMRLIRVLSPSLSAGSQVAFITCSGDSMGRAYWGPYAASKKALEELALSYREETEKSGIRTHIFEPGIMATKLRQDAFPGEDQSQLPQPEEAAQRLIDLLS